MKSYVIIGNGTASAACVEGIRSVDREGGITVVSGENHHVYSRPLISYLLEGKTDTERMKYRGDSFYADNGCDLVYARAVSLDPGKKRVALDTGEELPYDEVCVATGSRPFVPPIEGLDTVDRKFGFMTLDDALALREALTKESRVLIVGAGLIGLKCAEGIRDLAGSITVCDLADRVLSSILDPECAGIVHKHLEANGLHFMLGDTAVRFEGNVALMKSGKQVEFDVLVLAVGVRAETGLVKDAGGEVGRGIVTDGRMRSSLPSVFAAGDCAEGFDSSTGSNRVLAILPNAYMQGFTAGVNMAGGDRALTNAIPMNSIGFFGLHVMTAGSYGGEMTEERTESGLRRFFTGEDRLLGFMLIGETGRAGIYTSLIREKTPLSSIDFELMKKNASNMIYSAQIRRNKFGGVV